MATRRLFRPHWSPQILDEVDRNLALRGDLRPDAIHRRIEHLNRALPGALTEVPSGLVDAMPINAKDRHVLALAVHVYRRHPTPLSMRSRATCPRRWQP